MFVKYIQRRLFKHRWLGTKQVYSRWSITFFIDCCRRSRFFGTCVLTKKYERYFFYISFTKLFNWFLSRSFQSSKDEENDFAIDTEYLSSHLAKKVSIYIWMEINILNKNVYFLQKRNAIKVNIFYNIVYSLRRILCFRTN